MKTFVPYANTLAGLVLTQDNYESIGVNTLAYRLDLLLVKPGLNFLKVFQTLSAVAPWHGKTILDASKMHANKQGQYVIRSPYDGSQISLSELELIDVILSLKPDRLILSQPMKFDPSKFSNTKGIAFINDAVSPLQGFAKEEPEGLRGKFADDEYWVSDAPLSLSLQGKVNGYQTLIDLTSSQYAQEFEVLEQDCPCLTCQSSYTKAYLHHLYHHTPNLCQRFLAIHTMTHHLRQREFSL